MDEANSVAKAIKEVINDCGWRLMSDIIITNYDETAKIIINKDLI